MGSLCTIWTGDILGRPRSLLVGSIIIGVGAIIQASSYGVAQMIVGRIVAGAGTGMNTATASIWQAETSKFSSRGKLIIIQMVFIPIATSHPLHIRKTNSLTNVTHRQIASQVLLYRIG